MAELEITDNDFAPLMAAESVPQRLGLEGCDLVANKPPRQLNGLLELAATDCKLDLASLQVWLAACPNLTTLTLEGASLGDATWSVFPATLQRLHIQGGSLSRLLAPPATCGLQVLELSACQLQQVELPQSLPSLKHINLCFNPDLGACPDLPSSNAPFELDLRGCGLTQWPDVAGVDQVAKLDASRNAIGSVPERVRDYRSLSSLRLQHSSLTSIDAAIATLPHLTEVWLQDNPLLEVPLGLCQAPALKVLDLTRCQLSSFPESLCGRTTLEVLLLTENQIAHVPDAVQQLHNLRNLNLWKTGLQELPESLAGLDKLAQLDVSHNPIKTLPDLSGLPAIAHLGLCGLQELDWQQGFEQLAKLQRIRTIRFTNSKFSTFDARVLEVPGLERIDVNKTPIDAAVWRDFRANHPDVTIWGD